MPATAAAESASKIGKKPTAASFVFTSESVRDGHPDKVCD
jgi:hypothetical protein